MQCSKCHREAIIFQKYSGQHLCRQHFVGDLEAKAKRAIRTHRWMSPGDHIAVALSGDAASSALVFFLKKLTAQRRDIQVSAITVDEGIGGFRDPVQAQRIAKSLGVNCICGSFDKDYGITMDAIIQRKGTANTCHNCRVLRSFLLNRIAHAHGITKLALGSSLDDGAEDILGDVLCGAVERMILSRHMVAGVVPAIQPFMHVPASELCIYADVHAIEYVSRGCPHAVNSLQGDIRTMLEDYDFNHPGTKHALVNLRENLAGISCRAAETIPVCTRCGEPATGICRNCGMLDEYIRELF